MKKHFAMRAAAGARPGGGGAAASEGDWVAQIKKSQGRGGHRGAAPSTTRGRRVRLKENDVIVTRGEASVGMIFNDNSHAVPRPLTPRSCCSAIPTTPPPTWAPSMRGCGVARCMVTTVSFLPASQSAGAIASSPGAELQGSRASSYR